MSDDPYWVPPLIGDRKKFLDPTKNPSFEYLKVAYFVAEAVVIPENKPQGTITGGMERDVGTIATVLDPRERNPQQGQSSLLGLFECIDDHEVANALLDTRRPGCAGRAADDARPGDLHHDRRARPAGGRLQRTAPRILMPYTPPYYPELLEAYGLAGVKDLLAYKWDIVAQYGGKVENFPAKLTASSRS